MQRPGAAGFLRERTMELELEDAGEEVSSNTPNELALAGLRIAR